MEAAQETAAVAAMVALGADANEAGTALALADEWLGTERLAGREVARVRAASKGARGLLHRLGWVRPGGDGADWFWWPGKAADASLPAETLRPLAQAAFGVPPFGERLAAIVTATPRVPLGAPPTAHALVIFDPRRPRLDAVPVEVATREVLAMFTLEASRARTRGTPPGVLPMAAVVRPTYPEALDRALLERLAASDEKLAWLRDCAARDDAGNLAAPEQGPDDRGPLGAGSRRRSVALAAALAGVTGTGRRE